MVIYHYSEIIKNIVDFLNNSSPLSLTSLIHHINYQVDINRDI